MCGWCGGEKVYLHFRRPMNFPHRHALAALLFLSLAAAAFATNTSVHTTWLWHLHQPVYWPDRRDYGVDHYENAWDTIQKQNAGRLHPAP